MFLVNNFYSKPAFLETSLTAGRLGSNSLVPLLCDGQADTLSSGQGHPWLVALVTEREG